MLAGAYGLPGPLLARGISEGVENTNYFLGTGSTEDDKLRWVLTILEQPPDGPGLEFILELLESAHGRQLPVPLPLPTEGGQRHMQLAGKTVLVTPRLPGGHDMHPGPDACTAIGSFLGQIHARVRPKRIQRADPRGLDWLLVQVSQQTADGVAGPHPPWQLAATRLAASRTTLATLPTGTCHGDLFRDNVLFLQGELTGVIDWYNAATATLAYDLAIVLNDWCLDANGAMDADRTRALLRGYVRERPLSREECLAMPDLRTWAALRFWTSRTLSQQAERSRSSDPDPFHVNSKTYVLGDAVVAAANDGHYRSVFTTTVSLRNLANRSVMN